MKVPVVIAAEAGIQKSGLDSRWPAFSRFVTKASPILQAIFINRFYGRNQMGPLLCLAHGAESCGGTPTPKDYVLPPDSSKAGREKGSGIAGYKAMEEEGLVTTFEQ